MAAVGSGSTTCSATVRKRTGPSRVASSSRLPAQRWRVSRNGSPGSTSTQFAAIGAPANAAAWAIDLVAAVGPGAEDEVGVRADATSWATARPQAAGA